MADILSVDGMTELLQNLEHLGVVKAVRCYILENDFMTQKALKNAIMGKGLQNVYLLQKPQELLDLQDNDCFRNLIFISLEILGKEIVQFLKQMQAQEHSKRHRIVLIAPASLAVAADDKLKAVGVSKVIRRPLDQKVINDSLQILLRF
jgi:two-component SAPR family response regulator